MGGERRFGAIISVSEPTAARILGTDADELKKFREHDVVHLARNGKARSINEWGDIDIARAFCALRIKEKHTYGKGGRFIDYKKVTSEVNKLFITGKFKELMDNEDWKRVMRESAREGVIFRGTRFDFD